MVHPAALTNNQKLMFALLLSLTMMGATLTSGAALPGWVGGAMALGALFGTVLVFWRSGALRARFLVLFAAALAVAALAG